jgi:hypothetical protein
MAAAACTLPLKVCSFPQSLKVHLVCPGLEQLLSPHYNRRSAFELSYQSVCATFTSNQIAIYEKRPLMHKKAGNAGASPPRLQLETRSDSGMTT